MFYRKNMGPKERVARSLLGGSMIAYALLVAGISTAWPLAAAGAMVIATGMFGFCPACAMVGRRHDGPPQ
jgi:hypothetical protein